MSPDSEVQFVQRASIDGALCTIRCIIGEGEIPGTKGEWLGIEWDDPKRGKHDGTHHGRRYLVCQSAQPTVASFIRPSRKFDQERTVIEALRYKYGSDSSSSTEAVVISGKVAEEVGFEKIAQEQAVFEDLKILVLEKLCINGIAPRNSTREQIEFAQDELLSICSNVVELDLGYNTIESWEDICDICVAFPKLKILRLNGLRLRLPIKQTPSTNNLMLRDLKELQLSETLLKPRDVLEILGNSSKSCFPKLSKLWISQNELDSFDVPRPFEEIRQESIQELILENNLFTSLTCLGRIATHFPNLDSLSFQRNHIENISDNGPEAHDNDNTLRFPNLKSLSVSHNRITSFSFVDELSAILPNLTSLRLSGNPVYDDPQSDLTNSNSSETSYYLTLARLPSLKVLNYSQITSREREEGEIYYLSITEREVNSLASEIDPSSMPAKTAFMKKIEQRHPRYQPLCIKYDRESIITKIFAPAPEASSARMLVEEKKPNYPPGSIAAQLIQSTFYIGGENNTDPHNFRATARVFTRAIPASISTSQVFALVARSFHLPPLQFKLTYESEEFDPVRDDFTTRSQLYTGNKQSAAERYKTWGDWDADEIMELHRIKQGVEHNESNSQSHDGDVGGETPLRDGQRWKRREVEMLMGLRSWGDWLDSGINEARVRVDVP